MKEQLIDVKSISCSFGYARQAYGTTTYTYDDLNRLATVTEPNGKVTGYTDDRAGNRLTETVQHGLVGSETAYNYDSQNRLTLTTSTGGAYTKYIYDNNGNLVSKTSGILKGIKEQAKTIEDLPSFRLIIKKATEDGTGTDALTLYTYDKYNRLTKVKSNASTATYQYNAQGYRVKKTVNGSTTRYLYKSDKVVLELDPAGNQTAFQAYGSALLYRKAGGADYYYLYNAHGDVTALLDSSGTVAATYDYDAFGNVTDKTGTVNNHITYAGYQMDDETGLYYLNARYYDSAIARFITEDSYTGERFDPLSLNLYTYCSNNPVIYIDPSGHVYKSSDNELNNEAKAKIIALTSAEINAKTKAEKDKIQKQEQAIRNSRASWVENDSIFVIKNENSFDSYMGTALKDGKLTDGEWKKAIKLIDAKVSTTTSYSATNLNTVTVTSKVTTSIGKTDISVQTGAIYKGTSQVTASTVDCHVKYNIDYEALTGALADVLKEQEIAYYTEYLKQQNEMYKATLFSIEMDNMSFCMDYSNAITAVMRGMASADRLDELYKEAKSNNGAGKSWYKADGSINYPPNNGAIPGTEIEVDLQPGQSLVRYGNIGLKSKYVTAPGASPDSLSLPPNTSPSIYTELQVVKAIPRVTQSTVAPWGGSTGLGLQYELPMPIQELIKQGYINIK